MKHIKSGSRGRNSHRGLRSIITTALFVLVGFVPASRADQFYGAWLQEYDPTSPVSQTAAAIGVRCAREHLRDGRGQESASNVDQFYTAKYDALDGHLIWEMFESGGNTIYTANALAVDSAGNVVVTGSRNASGSIDYYTVKYNGVTGTRVWSAPATYDGTAGGQDVAVKVVTDSSDNVIVTGLSRGQNNGGNASGDDIVTIKYNGSTGAQTFIDIYTTASSRDDRPAALAVDSANNIIVAGTATTGSGIERFYVRKLNTSLTKIWDTATPIDTGGDGGATGVAIDSANNVVATGLFRDNANHHGFYTTKLAAADGMMIWETLNPPLSGAS